MPYFTELSLQEDAGTKELHAFMDAARRFLHDLLNNELQMNHCRPNTVPPLFGALRQEALAVFCEYVYDRFEPLHRELDLVDPETLRSLGLTGQAQHSKFRALADLEMSPGDEAAYWPRVGKMLQQIDDNLDAILDPLKIVAPGIDGFVGLFKEFRSPVFNLVNG